MNKVILVGRLTADPELRQTQSGVASCRFTVAVDRRFADKTTGESFQAKAFPEFIKNIMASGGLVGYTESELRV